ncbi:uncharacterized protein J3D65DRAFT_378260 [Phyllosticta citribraziliensis]|uniref:Uncharacterized protein n=1 Tax=Phyllosticta citribraziliensis TaxID=989973 RepID=A0ABR1LQB7_9PEZI
MKWMGRRMDGSMHVHPCVYSHVEEGRARGRECGGDVDHLMAGPHPCPGRLCIPLYVHYLRYHHAAPLSGEHKNCGGLSRRRSGRRGAAARRGGAARRDADYLSAMTPRGGNRGTASYTHRWGQTTFQINCSQPAGDRCCSAGLTEERRKRRSGDVEMLIGKARVSWARKSTCRYFGTVAFCLLLHLASVVCVVCFLCGLI